MASTPPQDVHVDREESPSAGRVAPVQRLWLLPEVRWAAIATALFAGGAVAQLVGLPAPIWWSLYLACCVTGGWGPAASGLSALRERSLDVDLLMVVAAVLAAAIGQVFEAALLIVIFATSGALERLVTHRTAESVRSLLELAPQRATRLRGGGNEESVDVSELAVGDRLLIHPGERIGADAQVVSGVSEVDQAAITGEPLPVLKEPGDEVFAGTYNGTGGLTVVVQRPASDSTVARIVALVEEASATKATTQLFIEKVEQRYSIVVVVAALLLFTVPLALGGAFEPTLLRAMTFMIVASPCAVVLATMPPLLSAIANAGRHGVLVKSAVVMEKLADTTTVAFDKTGTLTEGTPRIATVEVLPEGGLGSEELLALAAAVERSSEHPIARAILTAARDRGIEVPAAQDFASTPGRDVRATVCGRHVRIGSPALLDAASGPGHHAAARARVAVDQQGGLTAVIVLIDGTPAGVIGVADRLRRDAKHTVAGLMALTGRSALLLTGDNPGAAARIAGEVGIADVRAGMLPLQKADAIRELAAGGERVVLVGDGVNDAPAMATAHVGIAMGRAGSDLALETCDAVVVHDELQTLPRLIVMSRRAQRVVKANLAIAATVIAALVTWDIIGTLPLPLGVAGHEGSTVLVGLNGLRLLRAQAWRDAARSV